MYNNKNNNNKTNGIEIISWISTVDETQPSWNKRKIQSKINNSYLYTQYKIMK